MHDRVGWSRLIRRATPRKPSRFASLTTCRKYNDELDSFTAQLARRRELTSLDNNTRCMRESHYLERAARNFATF